MNQWRKLTLEDAETIPLEQTAALYLTPRRGGLSRLCDAGRFWTPDGGRVPYWDSAAGLGSPIDGRSVPYLLRRYHVWYGATAPLPPDSRDGVGKENNLCNL